MKDILSRLLLVLSVTVEGWAQNLRGIEMGFPARWDGHHYKNSQCHTPSGTRPFPAFLDGYFLCQLSAAYGRDFDPPGQKITHMIDAIGAVGSFHLEAGRNVTFSGEYYPSKPYKIWDYYGKDFRKSTVAWKAIFSPWNSTMERAWAEIPDDPDTPTLHPNINFWKIGKNVLGATESSTWVGLEFDIGSLTGFQKFPFVETSQMFRDPMNSPVKPIGMASLERTDPSGTIWTTSSAFNPREERFYQVIFSISPSGVRTVEGIFDFGTFNLSQCDAHDHYHGDKRALAGYGYSVTSTENYIVVPVTSVVYNPCVMYRVPTNDSSEEGIQEPIFKFDLDPEVPLRFLVFNKRTRRFTTTRPLETFPAMFVSTQFNAYETSDGYIVADMIAYESFDMYTKYLFTEYLKRQVFPSVSRLLRFTLDINQGRAKYEHLLPQEQISAEFAQINHQYDGREYKYGYVLLYPFAAGSQIMKIHTNDPSGRSNRFFSPGSNYALSEPWFVPRPSSLYEDDGVLLVRALDTYSRKTVLFAVDARTMLEISRVVAPVGLPFGFHNRYFSKAELGIPSTSGGSHLGRILPLMPPRPLKFSTPAPANPPPTTTNTPATPRPPTSKETNGNNGRFKPFTKPASTPRPTRPTPTTRQTPKPLPPLISTVGRWTTTPYVPPTRPWGSRWTTPKPTPNPYPTPRRGICNWLRDIFDKMGSNYCRDF